MAGELAICSIVQGQLTAVNRRKFKRRTTIYILYIHIKSISDYYHSRMLNCAMIHDLVDFAKMLEVALGRASDIMELLKPTFNLVGSIPEGTRIGIANELDITINFEGWRDNPPLVANIDGVHLYREEYTSNCLSSKIWKIMNI